ncbi:hypothetical protein F5Y10DRAFT_252224 [Nemania abortiva]|nr:hypothetical protein F5Y10DRAFT_252224 [Nemania abortiva]
MSTRDKHDFDGVRDGKFRCTCAQEFTRKLNLEAHIRSRADERPYSCNINNCGKTFIRQCDLARHKKVTHSGAKPFICRGSKGEQGCGMAFNRQSNLNRHIRTCKSYHHRKPCDDRNAEEQEGFHSTCGSQTESIRTDTKPYRSPSSFESVYNGMSKRPGELGHEIVRFEAHVHELEPDHSRIPLEHSLKEQNWKSLAMAGTSPFAGIPTQSPSFHSSSYIPKMEAEYLRNFVCCDLKLDTMHDLLRHYETVHTGAKH